MGQSTGSRQEITTEAMTQVPPETSEKALGQEPNSDPGCRLEARRPTRTQAVDSVGGK